MKKLVLVVVVLFVAVISAAAQQNAHVMMVQMPFAFHVQDKHAEAGNYLVSYSMDGNILMFLNKSTSERIFAVTYREDSGSSDETPKLVFHKYGDAYFLVRAAMPGQFLQGLPESKSERELVTHQVITKLNPETITVFGHAAK